MRRALVVHGCEGLDELSIAGASKVPKSLRFSAPCELIYV